MATDKATQEPQTTDPTTCDECDKTIRGEKYYHFDEVPYDSDKIADGDPCDLCVKCTAINLYKVYRTMEELGLGDN